MRACTCAAERRDCGRSSKGKVERRMGREEATQGAGEIEKGHGEGGRGEEAARREVTSGRGERTLSSAAQSCPRRARLPLLAPPDSERVLARQLDLAWPHATPPPSAVFQGCASMAPSHPVSACSCSAPPSSPRLRSECCASLGHRPAQRAPGRAIRRLRSRRP